MNESKIQLFEEWMKGDHVLLQIDSRREDVQLPAHLKDNYKLCLKLSYLFQGETKHDSSAISTYLKFSGQYQQCIIPWTAIWGISSSDGSNRIWPEDLPKEMLKELASAKVHELAARFLGKPATKAPSGTEETPPPKTPSKKRPTPLLRRLK